MQDQENTEQRLNKKSESELCTLNTREADIMTTKKPRSSKKKKVQESKSEPKEKYNCENCARSYTQKSNLNDHKRYECGVKPQFSCEFCGKQFKRKSHMNRHTIYFACTRKHTQRHLRPGIIVANVLDILVR